MTSPIWLYGSYARGDASSTSDVDVLLVEGASGEAEKRLLDCYGAKRLALTRYSWGELRAMARYGSLFLLHLAREGKPLWPSERDGELVELISTLPPYRRAGADLDAFRMTVGDVDASLLAGGSVLFELSVLASVFRHASVLASYLVGEPRFARRDCFEVAQLRLPFSDVSVDDLEGLYSYRLHECRGVPLPTEPTLNEATEWSRLAKEYILSIGRHI